LFAAWYAHLQVSDLIFYLKIWQARLQSCSDEKLFPLPPQPPYVKVMQPISPGIVDQYQRLNLAKQKPDSGGR